MKKFLAALFCLTMASLACSADLAELKRRLQDDAPVGYYPKNGKYKLFQDICNSMTCFDAVSVSYVTESKKGMRRLAVFARSGKYLGSYSGFFIEPVSSDGTVVRFQKSDHGDRIVFEGSEPPKIVWIDGEIFSFERAL
jgi:hypothetical protein